MMVLASLRMFLVGIEVIMKKAGSRFRLIVCEYFELVGCEAMKHILPPASDEV